MIGIFDSGLGGLTVARELYRILPQYDYLYLGDQARLPYGPRDRETITRFTETAINYLFNRGSKIVLIACNSATAASLYYLQQKYPQQHILGVVVPAAEAAAQNSRYGNIGVVGTEATIKSQVYVQEIEKAAAHFYQPQEKKAQRKIRVFQKATPLMVPLIEEDWSRKPETRMILRKYLRVLKDARIDTLILGCTHYPLIEKLFSRIMGKNCQLISSSKEQALALIPYLRKHQEIEKQLGKNQRRIYLTTDCPGKFAQLGGKFLGHKFQAQKITLNC